MRQILVGICDDDARVLRELEEAIADYGNTDREVDFSVKTFSHPCELLDDLDFDILFLDILFESEGTQLSTTGVQVLKIIREQGIAAPVVFISSVKSFTASKAGFTYNLLDYIVKPISPKEVQDVLARAMAQIVESVKPKCRIVLKNLRQTQMVYAEDIFYITMLARKRHVYLENNVLVTTGSLKDVYLELPHNQFVYIHSSFIVNLDKVDSFQGANVFLTNGDKLPLSRNYKQGFIKALHTFTASG